MFRKSLLVAFFLRSTLLLAMPLRSQETISPNLSDIVSGKGWKLFNRTASMIEDGGKRAIKLDERSGLGLAWLEGSNFDQGTIEIKIPPASAAWCFSFCLMRVPS
jgi:hypothetical protein